MKKRDEESFHGAFPALFLLAYRIAVRMLAHPATAEDVAAEALARAYARWSSIGEEQRRAWVGRVTTNLALDVTRKRSRHPEIPLPTEPPGALEAIDDDAATAIALIAALRALPRRQREVVVLRHLAGFSEREIVEGLGLAPGTVKTHLRRGLRALRGSLAHEMREERVVY